MLLPPSPSLLRQAIKSSYEQHSTLINPASKSEWITPAACGAVEPWATVQHRTSFTPRREVVHQLELFVPAFDNPGQHTVPTALDPRQESVRPRHVPGLVQRGQRIFKFDGKGDHQTAAVRVDPGFNVR